MKNSRVVLASRPVGAPKESNFSVEELDISNIEEGEVLVKNQFISIDSSMRGWMSEGKSYISAIPLGGVIRAVGTGVVIESKSQDYKVGEYVCTSLTGVQDYVKFPAYKNGDVVEGLRVSMQKINPSIIPPPAYLGALGIAGMTAYFGLLEVGKIKAGDTVVVSGAAGGVGTVAGQIAKIKGCKVIGITSSDEKGQHIVDNFNFDYYINYKTPNWRNQLLEICPDGIDIFFDNVGGDVLNILLTCLKEKARVVLSGAASQYNSNALFMRGPANYMSLIVKRATMEGFICTDYSDKFDEAKEEISQWILQGKLNAETHVVKGGVENFLQVFSGMFAGQNTGKMVLELDN